MKLNHFRFDDFCGISFIPVLLVLLREYRKLNFVLLRLLICTEKNIYARFSVRFMVFGLAIVVVQ